MRQRHVPAFLREVFFSFANFAAAAQRCVFVGVRLIMWALALFSAAHPAAPRARSNLVRLANAAEKHAHAVGPTRRYVARARLFLSRTRPRRLRGFRDLRAVRSHARRGGRGRGAAPTRLTRNTRIVARHLRHSSRGHASWPRGRWKTPRGLRARVSAARAPAEPLSALSPVLSFRLAIVPRREHQLWAVVSATIIFTKVLFS